MLVLRAPDRPLPRPMIVETAIGGRVVDRRTLMPGRWDDRADSGARRRVGPFRRIDVRVSPSWMDKRKLAQRTAEVDVAVTAMVSELRWLGIGAR